MNEDDGQCQLEHALERMQTSLEAEGLETLDHLLPEVYRELRVLAGGIMRGQVLNQTLQPTALVNEVYLKLVDGGTWKNRDHFFALAATVMRHVLADHARSRFRQKRGGLWNRVTIDVAVDSESQDQLEQFDLVALDGALSRLAENNSRQARIVELRFLAGMGSDAIASLLNVSRRTVELDWRFARAWLRRELEGDDAE